MKLKEIMTKSVESVNSTATLQEAARKMRDAEVGMLPVWNEGQLAGVVTDRDLVVRGLGDNEPHARVEEVMSAKPICLNQDSDVQEALETMMSKEVGRVLVTDLGNQVVGVVSAGDLAVACEGDPRVGRLAAKLGKAHKRKPFRVI